MASVHRMKDFPLEGRTELGDGRPTHSALAAKAEHKKDFFRSGHRCSEVILVKTLKAGVIVAPALCDTLPCAGLQSADLPGKKHGSSEEDDVRLRHVRISVLRDQGCEGLGEKRFCALRKAYRGVPSC